MSLADILERKLPELGGPLEPMEKDQLRVMVTSRPLVEVLRRIEEEAQSRGNLQFHDLASDEGVKKAIEAKGVAHGLRRAIEILTEACEAQDDDE